MTSSVPTVADQSSYPTPAWLQACTLADGGGASSESLICRAFTYAKDLHRNQFRASGEPYIIHPIQVATLLCDLAADPAMIAAGFLHDLLEDTAVTADELEALFGAEVRQLVEGVTKLSKFSFSSKKEQQAENFRRMFLAMAQDIRVIVVKLADRLHNMRTLEHLSTERQQRIAQETMDIFAPLANRLGIWQLKWELEDLSFKYLMPQEYQEMGRLIAQKRTEREAYIREMTSILKEEFQRLGIPAEVTGRPKHLWGIYQKMKRQGKEYSEIFDVSAVRVIVGDHNINDCYRALAVVHNRFRLIPGRFKDYVGLPKPNGYQSIHTAVWGPKGTPVEVQIRTQEMHKVAELGVAAHWKYKEAGSVALSEKDQKFTWLRSLMDWQGDLKDSQEYLQFLKEDLFESEVYVFTPRGDVIELPRGATSVDFAYRIHSEVGNRCTGARVNERLVPLETVLKNGDIVEIITAKNARPNLDWLNFVTTSAAKNRIRLWYKKSRREENVLQGRQILERELGRANLDNILRSETMLKIAGRLNYITVEDMLAGLGYGEITAPAILNKLRERAKEQELKLPPLPSFSESSHNHTDPILGIEGLPYHLGKCCTPLPGDPIIGVVTRAENRGITIHRQDCDNVLKVHPDQLIPVKWNPNSKLRPTTYPVEIEVEVIDRVGIFKDVLDRLASDRVNVRNASVKTFADQTAVITLLIDIATKEQFDHVTQQVAKISDVVGLRRQKPRSAAKS
ncbi:RelA/SpoT family protein [Anthocerotibacter panamensis]|uniref:RelA/SpoT family protein n=1 Tax=Anthocerotibacter panamensis TaxID=2857077 RepID=UPI001C403092|nr:bifunctional (p)ppGpp synthetase/guanosine-3',5'-bis(diphosphate) 3'-pyrophosphohydrolase [Anthocerotibacter panamensis]